MWILNFSTSISVLHNESIALTSAGSPWLRYVDILNESSTKIPWKVDYLFTAVVLKLKMCPKSGYWISVHRFQFWTMKASVWLQLVRRDFGMLDILYESSTKIPWKVDYHFTAVVLKMKKCPKIGYISTSISVLHNESIGLTSAGSPWLRFTSVGWTVTSVRSAPRFEWYEWIGLQY